MPIAVERVRARRILRDADVERSDGSRELPVVPTRRLEHGWRRRRTSSSGTVVEAARIEDLGSRSGPVRARADDRRRIAEQRVQVDRVRERVAVDRFRRPGTRRSRSRRPCRCGRQRPWSGGSTENWFPPLANRWSKKFSASKLCRSLRVRVPLGSMVAVPAVMVEPPEIPAVDRIASSCERVGVRRPGSTFRQPAAHAGLRRRRARHGEGSRARRCRLRDIVAADRRRRRRRSAAIATTAATAGSPYDTTVAASRCLLPLDSIVLSRGAIPTPGSSHADRAAIFPEQPVCKREAYSEQ